MRRSHSRFKIVDDRCEELLGRHPRLLGPDKAATVPESAMSKLDTASKYFAVLVALCEPRLRGSSMAAVPSVQEVATGFTRGRSNGWA